MEKFRQSASLIFKDKLIDSGKNIHDHTNAWISVKSDIVLMAQIDVQMRDEGYVCTLISATDKGKMTIHFRSMFPEEEES